MLVIFFLRCCRTQQKRKNKQVRIEVTLIPRPIYPTKFDSRNFLQLDGKLKCSSQALVRNIHSLRELRNQVVFFYQYQELCHLTYIAEKSPYVSVILSSCLQLFYSLERKCFPTRITSCYFSFSSCFYTLILIMGSLQFLY